MKEIKDLRIELDFINKLVLDMEPSRELSLCRTNTEEAKMNLGKVLGELKEPNPYPESRNSQNEVIEPTADTFKGSIDSEYSKLTHIQRIKYIRNLYKIITDKINAIRNNGEIYSKSVASDFAREAFMRASTADMWLGMELARINNSTKQ